MARIKRMVIEFKDPRPAPKGGTFKIECEADKVTPEMYAVFDATMDAFFDHYRTYSQTRMAAKVAKSA